MPSLLKSSQRSHGLLKRIKNQLKARMTQGRGIRLVRDEKGTTAVEFAIIAIPFFALLLMTLETSLMMFAQQTLEAGIQNASRSVRTGQAQQGNTSGAQFRQSVCQNISALFPCNGNLVVSVKTEPSFAASNLNYPINSGNPTLTGDYYNPGKAGDIVTAQVTYQWPVFFNFYGGSLKNLGNGKRLLSGSVAFRNEPF